MSDERQFQRRIEDFTCLHCMEEITGDGYTNHCPHCLHSKHVDINPGDRAADCDALMVPVRSRNDSRKGFMILHRCISCGHEKWNRAGRDDNIDEIVPLLGG
jgi:hypothetical protein